MYPQERTGDTLLEREIEREKKEKKSNSKE